ncbi:CocE/NonD family hydrolase [Dictyobacter aurantiacus]|uniref:Xaa-Pro dipeptidyl-peptidase C-terminal domain-containing protein n=1 Tax=Dictyobacter aurantiacus TaxID=1936993 RepID=A0A401ZT56_9CHLR|nr:CocE/NonD family hydrolase [Dictyobacter aurantiacus]GCE10051.1 hypothetical protein KDAU_73800 [Dictyobacter aurantiacus]
MISFTGLFPEFSYGLQASADVLDLTGMQIRWFDHWLKGLSNGVEQEKTVYLFVMGKNLWREEEDWPLPDTDFRSLYLHSQGHANCLTGDGWLSASSPGEEPEDVYIYDPHDPVPTVGGATLLPNSVAIANVGPRDQSLIEARADVLCYTTAPLEKPMEVTGPIELVLFVASSALDTDFTGKLVDVFPDGRAALLTDGILRARYRESFVLPELLEPNRVYQLRLDLGATANVFLPGHRICLEVSSSNFPCFDRNTNTGGAIAEVGEASLIAATNRVFHDQRYPSYRLCCKK